MRIDVGGPVFLARAYHSINIKNRQPMEPCMPKSSGDGLFTDIVQTDTDKSDDLQSIISHPTSSHSHYSGTEASQLLGGIVPAHILSNERPESKRCASPLILVKQMSCELTGKKACSSRLHKGRRLQGLKARLHAIVLNPTTWLILIEERRFMLKSSSGYYRPCVKAGLSYGQIVYLAKWQQGIRGREGKQAEVKSDSG